jgi:hypothetical protein
MSSPFEMSSHLRRPPHSAGEDESSNRLQSKTTSDGSATAAQSLGVVDGKHAQVMMRFDLWADGEGPLGPPEEANTVIAYVTFGLDDMQAPTNEGWPVLHGEVWEWLCLGPADGHFRLVRATASNVRATFLITDSTS